MEKSINGYDYIAHVLKGYGVTHVFYVEAMLRFAMKQYMALGGKAITAHSENAAAYMADGYSRVSKKPGVCMAQSIGSANLAGGVHEAWLAGTPLVAITGKKTPVYQYRGSYQEADHRLLFEGITKFNGEVTESAQLPVVMRACFHEAVSGKPRPVHIDMTNHTGRTIEVGTVNEDINVDDEYTVFPPFRPAAAAEKIDEAVAALKAAERPVIVIGRGAAVSGAGSVIFDLAKKADIPVVTTPDGKALIDENDDLWCGIVGGYGMQCANVVVRKSDLVIFIGTQAADQTTYEWKVPPTDTKVIQIDIDAATLGRNYPNCVGLLGDAKMVTSQLLEAVGDMNHGAWRAETIEITKETLDKYSINQNDDMQPIRPERLCQEISKALPDDAVLFSDTGYSAVWSATMIKMRPGQEYYRAAGSLGWAFPAAIGAKCAQPERPVICFTGDGAFYYHSNEMETAARHNINTVTIINNNSGLAQCRPDLNLVYKDDLEKVDARYKYPNVDLAKIAEEFGYFARTVTDPAEIGQAIKDALASGKPALIDVRTTLEAEAPSELFRY